MSGGRFEPIPRETEEIARTIIDSATRVHRQLGPGLMESVYEACLCHELAKRGVRFQKQLSLPVVYDDLRLDGGLRIDSSPLSTILLGEKIPI